jgi:hypothetical protein
MSRHQLTAARGAAKDRQAHLGDNGGNAGREGCARHNHNTGQAFLVTHRKLILESGRLALAGR